MDLLFIDDDIDIGEGLKDFYSRRGFETDHVTSLAHLRKRFETQKPPQVICCDFNLVQETGLDIYCVLQSRTDDWKNVGFVVLTGNPRQAKIAFVKHPHVKIYDKNGFFNQTDEIESDLKSLLKRASHLPADNASPA